MSRLHFYVNARYNYLGQHEFKPSFRHSRVIDLIGVLRPLRAVSPQYIG